MNAKVWSWVIPYGATSRKADIDWKAFRAMKDGKKKMAILTTQLRARLREFGE